MRYRIGEEIPDINNLGEPVGDQLVTFSAVLGLIIGVGFVVAGKRGKQFWLLSWGVGLVIASIAYLAAEVMGFV